MTVRVRLFALLKERAGQDSVEIDLPDAATVAEAIVALSALPGLDVLDRLGARMAVNREYATPDTRLRPTDELALITPVSGGAPAADAGPAAARVHARVTADALSLDALVARVADPAAGAVVTFHGLPRDIPELEYEAYTEMARERIAAILADCVERHGLIAAAAEHRVARVPAAEPSIIVAVSARHRGEAFAGAREALDRIKAEAPIWKIEVGADGSRRRVDGVLPS
jgi:molybdopterin synthase catalytic subunit